MRWINLNHVLHYNKFEQSSTSERGSYAQWNSSIFPSSSFFALHSVGHSKQFYFKRFACNMEKNMSASNDIRIYSQPNFPRLPAVSE